MRAERHAPHPHPILFLDGLERLERIAFVGPLDGKLRAGNQVVDVGEHLIEAVIDGIDVDGDRDPSLRAMRGGRCDGGRVVAVDVKQAGAGDLSSADLLGVEAQAIEAPPQHRPLAGGASIRM